MRITRESMEIAIAASEEQREALEAFEEAAQQWIDTRDDGSDQDTKRDARDELDCAVETVEGLGIKLL